MEDLLNPFPLVANVSGSYRGIRYKWIPEEAGTLALQVKDADEIKIIDTGNQYTLQRFYKSYHVFAELLIDEYLLQKEAEVLLGG